MSSQQFNAAVPVEALTGNIVLAFATEGLGIVDHEAVEDSASASIAGARMRVALQSLRARLPELVADADAFDVALA